MMIVFVIRWCAVAVYLINVMYLCVEHVLKIIGVVESYHVCPTKWLPVGLSVRLDVCFHVISVSASQDLLKVSAFLFTLTFDFMLNWIYSAPKYLISLQRHSCCEKSMSWACSVEYKNRLAAFCAQTRSHTHTHADCDVMGRKESFHLQNIAKFFVLAKTFLCHTSIHTHIQHKFMFMRIFCCFLQLV